MHVHHHTIVPTELVLLTQKVQVRALRQERIVHQLQQDLQVAPTEVVLLLQEVVVQFVVPALTQEDQEAQARFLQEDQEVPVVPVVREVLVEEGLEEEDDKPISIKLT